MLRVGHREVRESGSESEGNGVCVCKKQGL